MKSEKYEVGEHLFKNKSDKFYDQKYIFHVNQKDSVIQNTLKKGYLFEKNLLQATEPFIVGKNKLILDVGANIGTMCIPLSRVSPVHAFEPFPVNLKLLKKNIKENKADVKVHPVCVGNKSGKIHIGILNSENNYGNVGIVKTQTAKSTEVKMITIDSLKLKNIGLIKVDTEGSEGLVFSGMLKTVAESLPVIVFERNENRIEAGTEIQEFRKLGYTTLAQIGISDNFILLHKNHFSDLKKLKTIKVDSFKNYRNEQPFEKSELTGFRLFSIIVNKFSKYI